MPPPGVANTTFPLSVMVLLWMLATVSTEPPATIDTPMLLPVMVLPVTSVVPWRRETFANVLPDSVLPVIAAPAPVVVALTSVSSRSALTSAISAAVTPRAR